MYDGTFKSAEDIEEGDCLMSPSGRPTFVKTIRRTDVFGNFSMINMGDFFITKGHPVFVNGTVIEETRSSLRGLVSPRRTLRAQVYLC